MVRILYAEDDPVAARGVARLLRRDGFRVDVVHDGEQAVAFAQHRPYDVALLDWNLSGELTGLDVCRTLRASGDPIGLIIVTGRTDIQDKLDAFRDGADDFITKPLDPGELVARVRALDARISGFPSVETYERTSVVRLSHAHRTLHLGGSYVDLTETEYRLLDALRRSGGRRIDARELCSLIWGPSRTSQIKSLYVHIANLRGKLGPQHAWRLDNLRGEGYRFLLGPQP